MSLTDTCFVLLGFSALKKKELSTLISSHGGSIAFTLSNKVSHLLVSEEAKKANNNAKIKEASKYDIEVLQENDLLLFIQQNNNISNKDELNHSLSSPQAFTDVSTSKVPSTLGAPSVNMLVPPTGPISGEFKVALFGLNFVPGSKLSISFGKITPKNIEYHSPTSVVVTIEVQNVPSGEVPVLASNDGGKHFGPSCFFTFTGGKDPLKSMNQPEAVAMLVDKMENIRRSIEQLQHGLHSVENQESILYKELVQLSPIPLPAFLQPRPFVAPASPIPISPTPTKPLQTKLSRTLSSPPKPLSTTRRSTLKLRKEAEERLEDDQTVNGIANKTRSTHAVPELPLSEVTKEIKIFISSPFKDMNAERELLVKKIIPQIKRACGERDVVLTYVDFRWGVTESQNDQAQTLLMCLREIQRCSVFIGLYGERYGWSMRDKAVLQLSPEDELLKRSIEIAATEFPWVMQYKNRSVTEIEMRMILEKKHSGPKKAAWFYFRDPYYAETLPPDQRKLYSSEGPEETKLLRQLKSDIEGSDHRAHLYTRPSILEDVVLDDLQEYINQKYPKSNKMSSLDSERFRHSAYARGLCRVYQPKEEYFLQLDKHAASNTGVPLVVLGESGMGKSALLANWSDRYRQHHPEALLISHFVGCSPASSNYGGIILRIMRELVAQALDTTSIVPADAKTAIEEFPRFIEDTLVKNKRSQLVIIIDGLDNLDDRENALELLWLPHSFPKNVCVVYSLAPGKVADVLNRRNHPNLSLKAMEEAERKALIRVMLAVNSKKLSAKQEFQIASYPQSGNPRFLRVLLDDIIVWGQFEELDTKIARDLKANTTSELYEIMLERLEADYGKEVVKNLFAYLGCSRRGLYLDTELEPLLQKKQIDNKSLNSVLVVVEDLLFSSLGLIGFSNRDISKAVQSRYLQNQAEKLETHKQLADLFQAMEGYPERKIEELCWQLEKASAYQRLRECVTNLSVFNILYTVAQTHKFDLIRYWRTLENNLKLDVAAEYKVSLERRSQFPNGVIVGDLFFRVASFLEDIGKYDGAEYVFLKARDHFELSAQNIMTAKCDYALGRVLLMQARYAECEKTLQKAMALYVREKGPQDVDVAQVLMRLGQLYTELNRFKEAEEVFENSLQIRIQKLGPSDVRVGQTLKHMLSMYEGQGNLEKVLSLGARALEIMEARLGPGDLSVGAILVQMGHVYMRKADYKQAEIYFERALQIVNSKLGPEHPHTADHLYELGSLYFVRPEEIAAGQENQNEWAKDKADEYFLKALKIKESSLGPNHPDVARILTRLGSLYIERVQLNIAEKYLVRAYEIRKQKLGQFHARTGQTLKHLMTLYQSQENVPKAIAAGIEAKKIFDKIGGPSSMSVVAHICVRLSELYMIAKEDKQSENTALAQQMLNRALEIQEASLPADHPEVKEIRRLITNLSQPRPKSPTKNERHAVGQTEAVPVINIKDLVIDDARKALLKSIREFGGKKLSKKLFKRKKNYFDSADWWKQNYEYKKK